MAENTKIEWATHTFNPWEGCTKVGPGCDHCYAENRNARFGGGTSPNWGAGAPRRRTSVSNWQQPLKWNREAAASGVRPRVFCASLADWLDNEVPIDWLCDLLDLIRKTPNLDWLLLTKRVGNWRSRLIEVVSRCTGWDEEPRTELRDWLQKWLNGTPPANVWIGATIVNQLEADRDIPKLLRIPARVRFLSMEPLLGPVDLDEVARLPCRNAERMMMDPTTGAYECCKACDYTGLGDEWGIDWVIAGGESGQGARPMHPDWARSLRDQCAAASAPFLWKQWGEWRPPLEGEDFNTAYGLASKPPAYLVDPSDGTVHCFYPRNDNSVRPEESKYKPMIRVGKKAAGRLLDGVEHNGFPQAAA